MLDSLLRAYTSCFDQYFGLLSSELQDPNNLMTHLEHDLKAAGILLLLMIAIGATASPVPEMHTFAIGMAEICRTALPDLMEDDVSDTRPDILSHCALLLLYLGMWSGERWLMRAGHPFIFQFILFVFLLSVQLLTIHFTDDRPSALTGKSTPRQVLIAVFQGGMAMLNRRSVVTPRRPTFIRNQYPPSAVTQ